MSKERIAKLLALLGELEGELDSVRDPELVELRATIGAALAALHRANVERRLALGPFEITRH